MSKGKTLSKFQSDWFHFAVIKAHHSQLDLIYSVKVHKSW